MYYFCDRLLNSAYDGFIGRNHVFHVDESIVTPVKFKLFQGFLDEITDILSFLLGIVDSVTEIHVSILEQVKDREDLSIVRDEGFTDHIGRFDEMLQDLQGGCDNFWVSCVQGLFDWNDQLRYYRQDLAASLV